MKRRLLNLNIKKEFIINIINVGDNKRVKVVNRRSLNLNIGNFIIILNLF